MSDLKRKRETIVRSQTLIQYLRCHTNNSRKLSEVFAVAAKDFSQISELLAKLGMPSYFFTHQLT